MPTRLSRRLARSSRLFSNNAYASVAQAAQSLMLSKQYPQLPASDAGNPVDVPQTPVSTAPQPHNVKVTATVTSTTTSSGLVRTRRVVTRHVMGAKKQCTCCRRQAAGKFIEHFEDEEGDGHEGHHEHHHRSTSPSSTKTGSSPSKNESSNAAQSEDTATDTGIDRCYPHCRFYDHTSMEDPSTQPFRHDELFKVWIQNPWPTLDMCDDLVDCLSHRIELRLGEYWNGWAIELQVLRDELEPELELRRLTGDDVWFKRLKTSASNTAKTVPESWTEQERKVDPAFDVISLKIRDKSEDKVNDKESEKQKQGEKETEQEEDIKIKVGPERKSFIKTKIRSSASPIWPLHNDAHDEDLVQAQLKRSNAIVERLCSRPSPFADMVDMMDGMHGSNITKLRRIGGRARKSRSSDGICGSQVSRSESSTDQGPKIKVSMGNGEVVWVQSEVPVNRKDSAMSLPPVAFAATANTVEVEEVVEI